MTRGIYRGCKIGQNRNPVENGSKVVQKRQGFCSLIDQMAADGIFRAVSGCNHRFFYGCYRRNAIVSLVPGRTDVHWDISEENQFALWKCE